MLYKYIYYGQELGELIIWVMYVWFGVGVINVLPKKEFNDQYQF